MQETLAFSLRIIVASRRWEGERGRPRAPSLPPLLPPSLPRFLFTSPRFLPSLSLHFFPSPSLSVALSLSLSLSLSLPLSVSVSLSLALCLSHSLSFSLSLSLSLSVSRHLSEYLSISVTLHPKSCVNNIIYSASSRARTNLLFDSSIVFFV